MIVYLSDDFVGFAVSFPCTHKEQQHMSYFYYRIRPNPPDALRFLAHLSRRLICELIVYPWSSVRP